MKFKKRDDAVSPVIGVILMVAITVILAAVVAAFAFGMPGNIEKTKVIAATVTQKGSTLTVVYQGGPDTDKLRSFSITWPNGTITSNGTQICLAGSVYNGMNMGTSGQDRVVATASFDDGTSQVILDTYV